MATLKKLASGHLAKQTAGAAGHLTKECTCCVEDDTLSGCAWCDDNADEACAPSSWRLTGLDSITPCCVPLAGNGWKWTTWASIIGAGAVLSITQGGYDCCWDEIEISGCLEQDQEILYTKYVADTTCASGDEQPTALDSSIALDLDIKLKSGTLYVLIYDSLGLFFDGSASLGTSCYQSVTISNNLVLGDCGNSSYTSGIATNCDSGSSTGWSVSGYGGSITLDPCCTLISP